jgi:hypothetical protein
LSPPRQQLFQFDIRRQELPEAVQQRRRELIAQMLRIVVTAPNRSEEERNVSLQPPNGGEDVCERPFPPWQPRRCITFPHHAIGLFGQLHGSAISGRVHRVCAKLCRNGDGRIVDEAGRCTLVCHGLGLYERNAKSGKDVFPRGEICTPGICCPPALTSKLTLARRTTTNFTLQESTHVRNS